VATPPSRAAPSRWGWRTLTAAYVAAVGIVIALLAGELVLRLERRAARRDADQYKSRNVFANPWEMNVAHETLWQKPWKKYKPNARLDLTVGGERYEIRINSLGFRTEEFSPQKPAGTFRALCIGGSTTVAGRTNAETYPAILERALRERHPGVPLEVLNLGISGTTSEYWLERRQTLFGFEPDLVVEYRAVNDIFWRYLPRYAERHPWRSFLHRSLLLERLFPLPPASFDPLFRETDLNFLQMDRLCREHGARYLTATFAAPDYAAATPGFRRYLDTSLDFWNRELPLHDYPEYEALVARHNERLELFAHEHRMEVVPVGRELRHPGLFIDICHFTPEGIEKLALALLPAVSRVIGTGPWRGVRRPRVRSQR
jgi:lysophospholipase L1-like esterase